MKKNIINSVVDNDMCVGCGLCTYKNEKKLEMSWNDEGFLVPKLKYDDAELELDLEVCPFNPKPDKNVKTENEIANIFLKDAKHKHPRIGRFNNLFVGYADEFRSVSSSGGIATFVFKTLLESGEVDHVISVKGGENNHYEFSISSSVSELLESTNSKYYPVTMATIIPEINKLNGTVAVSGIACFIKSIRLAQYYHPELNEKIKFLVGIICGGLKSSFFAEYMASKSGIHKNNFKNPNFRVKDPKSSANDYSFESTKISNGTVKKIKMREIGQMWGTGLFKANACDFCDDVTTELADISVGDAWIQPYVNDGKGTSVVLTRSLAADMLIKNAILKKHIKLESLSLDKFMKSQSGSFNHRQKNLGYRIKNEEIKGSILPPKRFNEKIDSFPEKIVQIIRRKSRKNSLKYWKEFPDFDYFDKKMKSILFFLKIATSINHKYRSLKSRLITKKKF